MSLQRPAAVLLDMDGTLIDSEPYWMRAEFELVGSFGGTWTEADAHTIIGSGLWVSAGVIQSHGVDLSADEIVYRLTDRVREQLATDGVPWRPGAVEFVRHLRDAGVATALVTMSVERMATEVASQFSFPAFDAVITGDIVSRPKPHPEAYLRAAELLGAAIADCVAIEDSISGIAAALASGAATIAVPHMARISEEPGLTIWPTLEGRTIDDLNALLDSRSQREEAGDAR